MRRLIPAVLSVPLADVDPERYGRIELSARPGQCIPQRVAKTGRPEPRGAERGLAASLRSRRSDSSSRSTRRSSLPVGE